MIKDNAKRLDAVRRKLESLSTLPLYAYRHENGYKLVFGAGSPQASIMFIGEAPGKQEALKGEPFVGAAGRVLDQLLQSVGLDRGQVYITNILKDRPPENRDPRRDEIEQYVPFLRQQIEIIQPRIIVTLGRFAMQFIFEEFNMPEQGGSITTLHGKPLSSHAAYGHITVLPLFHPAVAFYRRDQKEILERDFKVLRSALEKEKP